MISRADPQLQQSCDSEYFIPAVRVSARLEEISTQNCVHIAPEELLTFFGS